MRSIKLETPDPLEPFPIYSKLAGDYVFCNPWKSVIILNDDSESHQIGGIFGEISITVDKALHFVYFEKTSSSPVEGYLDLTIPGIKPGHGIPAIPRGVYILDASSYDDLIRIWYKLESSGRYIYFPVPLICTGISVYPPDVSAYPTNLTTSVQRTETPKSIAPGFNFITLPFLSDTSAIKEDLSAWGIMDSPFFRVFVSSDGNYYVPIESAPEEEMVLVSSIPDPDLYPYEIGSFYGKPLYGDRPCTTDVNIYLYMGGHVFFLSNIAERYALYSLQSYYVKCLYGKEGSIFRKDPYVPKGGSLEILYIIPKDIMTKYKVLTNV